MERMKHCTYILEKMMPDIEHVQAPWIRVDRQTPPPLYKVVTYTSSFDMPSFLNLFKSSTIIVVSVSVSAPATVEYVDTRLPSSRSSSK